MVFQDRQDAGRQLAKALKGYEEDKPLILALPRGGVPIGYEVAKILKAPLDVFVVRKVGAPWNPEFGVGAVAPGVQILDQDSLNTLNLTPADMQDIIEQEQEEVERRLHLYRQDKTFPDLAGKVIVLVDDGVATGVTTRAAIHALKKLKPAKLILAVPVGPQDTIRKLKETVDDLVCLETPLNFYAVSAFYQHFPQVSDGEVVSILQQAKRDKK